LRGTEDVSAELNLIQEESDTAKSQPTVTFVDMFKGALFWPLFIAVMMMFSQQLSGINAAMFYSTQIFRDAGLRDNWPIYATILMGMINIAQTVVSLWLVDHPKFGRRSLHLIGLTGMFFSSIFIVVSISIANSTSISKSANQTASYASIIFVLLFVVSFATGPGSIPWFFVSEIFPPSATGKANSIAVMANWLANFLVACFFLPLNGLLGQYTFLVFACFLFVFIIFTFKFVPETKGKPYEEIKRDLASKKNLSFK
jgi:SP family facilitated glucose transporter-like MFS transporter 1